MLTHQTARSQACIDRGRQGEMGNWRLKNNLCTARLTNSAEMIPGASETRSCNAFIDAVGDHYAQLSTRVPLKKKPSHSGTRPQKDHGPLTCVLTESQFLAVLHGQLLTPLPFTTRPGQKIDLGSRLKTEKRLGSSVHRVWE